MYTCIVPDTGVFDFWQWSRPDGVSAKGWASSGCDGEGVPLRFGHYSGGDHTFRRTRPEPKYYFVALRSQDSATLFAACGSSIFTVSQLLLIYHC